MALNLGVFLLFAIEPGPTVQVRPGYHVRIFGIATKSWMQQGRELFVYHWHPSGRSQNRDPHLHISAVTLRLTGGRSRQVDRKLPIDKAHFPTGQVTLQQVIRLLIEDLGVEPRVPNWQEVLEENL